MGDGGRRGEVAHGGRASVGDESKKRCTGSPFFGGGGSLKNLTTGLIWLVTRVGGWGRRGEVAHGGRARGEMGGEVHWFLFLGSLKT